MNAQMSAQMSAPMNAQAPPPTGNLQNPLWRREPPKNQDFPHWPYQYMQTLPGAQSDTGKVAGESSNRWYEMAALNSVPSHPAWQAGMQCATTLNRHNMGQAPALLDGTDEIGKIGVLQNLCESQAPPNYRLCPSFSQIDPCNYQGHYPEPSQHGPSACASSNEPADERTDERAEERADERADECPGHYPEPSRHGPSDCDAKQGWSWHDNFQVVVHQVVQKQQSPVSSKSDDDSVPQLGAGGETCSCADL
eukprot:s4029_g5.t5